MRRLYLLRHAKSSWDDPSRDDFERPLASRGVDAAHAVAGHLAKAGIRPALVLCSTAQRARETLAALDHLMDGVPIAFEDGLYAAAKHDLTARLRRLDDHLHSVLLVGHNPGLEHLARGLCAGHGDPKAIARMEEKFPTAALAVLECDLDHWRQLQDGTCQLAEFIRPKDLG